MKHIIILPLAFLIQIASVQLSPCYFINGKDRYLAHDTGYYFRQWIQSELPDGGPVDGIKLYQGFLKRLQWLANNYDRHAIYSEPILSNIRESVESTTSEICEKFDSDLGKIFPHRCFTKKVYCDFAKMIKNVFRNIQPLSPESNYLQLVLTTRWVYYVPPDGGHWVDSFKINGKIANNLLFNQPFIKNNFNFQFDDKDTILKSLTDRIFDYVKKNNIEGLKNFMGRFYSLRDNLNESCKSDADEASFGCKIVRLFRGLDLLFNDTDRTEWDVGAPNPLRPREEISMLWLLLHPDLQPLFNITPETDVVVDRLNTTLKSVFDYTINRQEQKIAKKLDFFSRIRVVIRKACQTKHIATLSCPLKKTFSQLSTLVDEVKSAGTWTGSKIRDLRTGTLVLFIVTGLNNFVYIKQSRIKRITQNVFKSVYTYSKLNDVRKMQRFINYMPTIDDLEYTTNGPCAQNMNNLKINIACLFKSSLREIYLFLNSQKGDERNTKIISTDLDSRELLRQARLEGISNSIETQTLEIKTDLLEFTDQIKQYFDNGLGQRFGALETYFKALATFDGNKAEADIGFINGRLKSFTDQIADILPDLKERMQAMIIGSITANAADLAQRIAQLVVTIATGSNPFDPEPADVMDAANEVAQSTVSLIKAVRLQTQFSKLTNLGIQIGTKFGQNYDYLIKVKAIVAGLREKKTTSNLDKEIQIFLKNYTDYDPQVQKQDLTEYATTWEQFVEQACETLYAGGTVASAVVEAVFAGRGDCMKTAVQVQQIMEIYSEMYDYQFDFMETLATSARAYLAKIYSENLNTRIQSFETIERPEDNTREILVLEETALSLFLLYRLHTLQAVDQHCNYLEYKSAGVRPKVCVDALKTLNSREIQKLIAYVPTGCPAETIQYVDIPIKPRNAADQGYINVTRLHGGKEVSFQIPNVRWLQRQKWITVADKKDTAFYVVKFELFLYSEDSSDAGLRTVNVMSSARVPAYLFPRRGFRYGLQPHTTFTFEYQENAKSCRSSFIDNPYSSSRPKLCVISLHPSPSDDIQAYPSLFSVWRVKALPPRVLPQIPNGFSLKAGIQLCKVKKPS